MTFNGNEYIGIKPSCSLWLGKEKPSDEGMFSECVNKVLNESVNKEVSETILQQLGGRRFIVMTGAKDFVAIDNGLRFRIGKNSSRANIVKVILQGDDTYTMQFVKQGKDVNEYDILLKYADRGLSDEAYNKAVTDALERAKKNAEPKVLKEYNGLFFDQLREFFTEFTKMNLTL
jgi:hypothetical protein